MNSIDLIKVLVDLDLYSYIHNIKNKNKRDEIFSKCILYNYKKGDTLYYKTTTGNILIHLDGNVNIRAYLDNGTDYTVPWEKNVWIGLSNVISNIDEEYEIIFLEDVKILLFPLKDILDLKQPENMSLWENLAKIEAKNHVRIRRKATERVFLTKDIIFLNFLVENKFSFEGMTMDDISNRTNLGLRTLQRIIKKLSDLKLIAKDKKDNHLYVKDTAKILEYINNKIY